MRVGTGEFNWAGYCCEARDSPLRRISPEGEGFGGLKIPCHKIVARQLGTKPMQRQHGCHLLAKDRCARLEYEAGEGKNTGVLMPTVRMG
jgi:hypothetical protein